MSIEGKHHYRFTYLKSEEWKTVRIEALARENGKCQICGEENLSNDAHHVWYPESIWDTRAEQLAILCRACHDFVHAMMPECKTNDEEVGRAHWSNFRNAIIAWRTAKWDSENLGLTTPITTRHLRERLDALNSELKKARLVSNDPEVRKCVFDFVADLKIRLLKFENKVVGASFNDDSQQRKFYNTK